MTSLNYFKSVSNLTIAISLLIGIGAIFLIERIVPAIDEIMQENAYSVQASNQMLLNLPNSKLNSSMDEQRVARFWRAYQQAVSNITIKGEAELLSAIRESASNLIDGKTTEALPLQEQIIQLSNLNLETMETKNNKAKTIGHAGAWALGFLVILSLLLQLALRAKILLNIIEPHIEISEVIRDYTEGNKQRRANIVEGSREIKEAGRLLNQVLDQR